MLGRLWQRWRAQREQAAVARRAIPDDLWKRTLIRYPFLQRRAPEDAAELRRLSSLFLDRKEFSAAGGLRLSNAIVVAIAAQAVLPVLKLGLARYDRFVGIVVHPDEVRVRREVADDAGVVHEYDDVIVGEAIEGGPMMLSWHAVRSAGRMAAQGYNVVIHEFAHVLDEGGAMPLLPAELPQAEWKATLAQDYARFVERVDAEEDTALDPYGAEAIEEFFCVATEAFFVKPAQMRDEHPALYAMFVRFYGQDPQADTPPLRR